MRILFLGDVMGRSGREGLAKSLPELKERFSPEVVIANVENAAAGRGVTGKLAQEMLGLGINCLTSGNHVWEQKGIIEDIENEPRLLRPLNHVEGTPGKGSFLHVLPDGRKILIANVMGCLFINAVLDNPFSVTEKFLQKHELGREVQAIFMDFHAEASSEKMAFAHNFDGRVSAVIGTHTHIPTADAHI